MNVFFLFATTVLIWGSTWLAVKWQLGEVDPGASVLYRNGIATVLLFAWCFARGVALRFALRDHLVFMFLGIFLFSVNYWLVYQAAAFLTTGLIAVVFSTIVFFNLFTARLMLGYRINLTVVWGALVGISGIVLLFSGELSELSLQDKSLTGLLIALTATLCASIGSVTATYIGTNRSIPVIPYNAWGLFYGCVALFIALAASGTPFAFEQTARYTLSLLYLGIFGTAIAFVCYLKLIGLVGPDKAGYAFLMFPVVALALSTIFEAYRWSITGLLGLALIIAGSYLALRAKRKP